MTEYEKRVMSYAEAWGFEQGLRRALELVLWDAAIQKRLSEAKLETQKAMQELLTYPQ